MGRVYYNGLHWNSPVDSTPQLQYAATPGFQSAFVVAQGEISFNNFVTHYNGWKDQCAWIQNHGRTQEIVLRLYWPSADCQTGSCPMAGDPGASLGQQFYNEIVQYAVDNFNIRNFQVLNELNIEYECCKPRAQLAGDMFNIAWHIKHLANQNNRGIVYLGFPGPGGDSAEPTNPDWNAYWDFYKTYITMGTDQGPAYNWLAVHAYDGSSQPVWGLQDRMNRQYDSLVSKLPQYPHRWTEYGIPMNYQNSPFGSPPWHDPQYQDRAWYCRSAIQSFKIHVESKNPAGPDVWSVFYYIAYNSDAEAQGGLYGRLQLVEDDNHLTPAGIMAAAF
jgi:hypothetical protein